MELKKLVTAGICLVSFLVNVSIAPDMGKVRSLGNNEPIETAREGTYRLEAKVRRVGSDGKYAEFVHKGESFWAKVPEQWSIPETAVEITVIKNGGFLEVAEMTPLDTSLTSFEYLGVKSGKHLVKVDSVINAVDHEPRCKSGKALINTEEKTIERLQCNSSSEQ